MTTCELCDGPLDPDAEDTVPLHDPWSGERYGLAHDCCAYEPTGRVV